MHIRNLLHTIDHHHGQANRTVLSGYPAIQGATMRDKAAFYLENLSWVHEALIREPRGHKNMLGAIVTQPVSKGAAFGLLFLHAFGLFDSCGDSTFGASFAALESGLVPPTEPLAKFKIDTVLGPLSIEADVEGGIVSEVRYENVPSYEVGKIAFDVPGRCRIELELGFGGNYHGFVDADALGIAIEQQNEAEFVQIANAIWNNGGLNPNIVDPETGTTFPLTLVSFIGRRGDNHFAVAHVYPPGRMGRTPGGTGTCALMAMLHGRGQYDPSQKFTMTSVMGASFTGTGTPVTLANGTKALRPKLGTKSYMMGVHQFVIDPADPFARGFVLES